MGKGGFYIKVELKGNVVGVSVVEKQEEDDTLTFYYRNIGCRMIDIVRYSDEVDIVVDDEGLLQTGNEVFEVISELYLEPLHLAGTLIIGRSEMTEDGMDTVGFDSRVQAVRYFKEELEGKLAVVGKVR